MIYTLRMVTIFIRSINRYKYTRRFGMWFSRWNCEFLKTLIDSTRPAVQILGLDSSLRALVIVRQISAVIVVDFYALF